MAESRLTTITMTLTKFKQEIKEMVGRKYTLTTYALIDETVLFSMPPRKLSKANTVGLAFESSRTEGELSHADFPKATGFIGDTNKFSFTYELSTQRMEYVLEPAPRWMITVLFPNGTIKFYKEYCHETNKCLFTDNKTEADTSLTKNGMWQRGHELKNHFDHVEKIRAVVHHADETANF